MNACNIIATGESLKGFPLHRLNKHQPSNYSVNRAYRYVDCKYLVFYDFHGYNEFYDFGGQMITITQNQLHKEDPDIMHFWHEGRHGFNYTKGRVSSINNSGFMAINVAINMGFKRIYLLGYDMGWKYVPHFYDEPETYKPIFTYKDQKNFKVLCLPHFDGVVLPDGVEVINVVNPDYMSNLKRFPTITQNEYLKLI